jgi:hypothetical protein
MTCADEVNLLGDNIDIIKKKNRNCVIGASKEVSPEVNAE